MIGERIKEYREGLSIKVAAFAKQIGISQGSLSDIENGNTKPSATTLSKIVRNTDIDAAWLLTGEVKAVIIAEDREVYKKPVNPRTAAMAANFEALNEDDKRALERITATLAQSQKGLKKTG